jgi:Family of unknown function (DUF6459)
MPPRAFAVVRILRTGRRNMPSTRTPDSSADTSAAPLPVLPPHVEKAVTSADPPSAPPPAPVPAFGGLRLIEVPGGWPPYDCEVHGATCTCAPPDQGAAAPGASGRAEPPGPSLTCNADHGADPAVAWSRQFAQVIAEILAGARSPRQLAPWTTERVRDRIGLLTQTLTPGQKPRIRRIVTSRPTARVVEMTVVLSFGPRSRALALRLEHLPGRRPAPGLPVRPARWLCTEIEIG